jgi:hypothetical protein
MVLAWAAALLVFQKGAEADPSYDISVPVEYKATAVERRWERSVSPEAWARIRLTLAFAKSTPAQPDAEPVQADVLPFVTLPPDSKTGFSTVSWGEFTLGVVEYHAVIDGLPVFGMTTAVPLREKALLLTLQGADPLEADLRRDFQMVMITVKGLTPWLTRAERQRRATARLCDTAGLALYGLYLVVWAAAFRGNLMYAHLLRTAWMLIAGSLLVAPLFLGTELEVRHLFLNLALPLALFSMAGRRIKLAVDA